ncbi:MAG: T9SS type A sorting domain-containing protein [Bacteroidetes bacterium]|nr:T9SS type A sorting domain-containing protein [Bacteroidota bacterium]
MKKFLSALFFLGSITAFSQTTTSFRIPCSGQSTAPDPAHDPAPAIVHVNEADNIDDESDPRIKDSLEKLYRHPRTENSTARNSNPQIQSVPAPVVNRTFAGNGFGNSTPCDNEIAIANNGHLISVQNSNIFRYRTATNQNISTQSLAFWAGALGNIATKYDPKVIYDPEADRFILVCLAGYSSGSTNIIIGFSKTDTANGAYNLYELPGNPFSDTLWTDYPMIAVNHNELFCTVNLLHDNQSWQTGFVQSLIWQVNKWDGYAGDTLRTQLHSNIQFGGKPIRDICPVEGGSNTFAGPDMYFLSDRNLAASNDSVFLLHLTDTANAPGQQLNVTLLQSNISYFMPPNAVENGGDGGRMATNDARVLGAFMENNKIQYVHNTMDTSTGKCAVYYGIISNATSSPFLSATIIGDTALEYGYPNIAYTGYGAGDDHAMIFFLHCDSLTAPGHSVIAADGNGNFSSRTNVKSGLGYIDVLTGDERWGDYSGIQRKYDVGGTCWVNGMYGTSSHALATWVSEIGMSADVGVNENQNALPEITSYPNPFTETFNVVFTNEKTQNIRFVIYDAQGKETSVLLNDQFAEGKMNFTFNAGILSPGIYFLRAEGSDGSVLFTQRLVRQ